MRLVTVAGPPSCGKTAVLSRACGLLAAQGMRTAVVKFDCLQTRDADAYAAAGITAVAALSGGLCPDHFFATNLEEAWGWAAGTGRSAASSKRPGCATAARPICAGRWPCAWWTT